MLGFTRFYIDYLEKNDKWEINRYDGKFQLFVEPKSCNSPEKIYCIRNLKLDTQESFEIRNDDGCYSLINSSNQEVKCKIKVDSDDVYSIDNVSRNESKVGIVRFREGKKVPSSVVAIALYLKFVRGLI